jgi:hypothetical protein
MSRALVSLLVVGSVLVAGATPAAAQVFGTFTWQTQPYCNRLTLTLTTTPAGFAATGSDDLCGAPKAAGATGVVTFNPDGTVGLTVAIVPTTGTRAVTLTAVVSPANGQGTWTDSAGNGGQFALGGSTPGLPARPAVMMPIDIADNPLETMDPCFDSPLTVLTLCGVSASYWQHGGLGMPGLQVWRDEDSRVHVRGSVVRSGTFVSGSRVFVLPPGYRPARTLTFSVGMSLASQNRGGRAMVVIYGPNDPELHGVVVLQFETDPADRAVHFGELVFSVDR